MNEPAQDAAQLALALSAIVVVLLIGVAMLAELPSRRRRLDSTPPESLSRFSETVGHERISDYVSDPTPA